MIDDEWKMFQGSSDSTLIDFMDSEASTSTGPHYVSQKINKRKSVFPAQGVWDDSGKTSSLESEYKYSPSTNGRSKPKQTAGAWPSTLGGITNTPFH